MKARKIKVAISWFGDCMGDGTPIYDMVHGDIELEGVEEDKDNDGTRFSYWTQEQIDKYERVMDEWWDVQAMLEEDFK